MALNIKSEDKTLVLPFKWKLLRNTFMWCCSLSWTRLLWFLGLRMKNKSLTIQRYHYAVFSSLAVYYHHFAEHCGAFRGPICSHARVIDPTGLLSFFFSVSCIFSTPSKVMIILIQFTFLGINMFWAILRATLHKIVNSSIVRTTLYGTINNKTTLSRAKNISMPANMNSIVLLCYTRWC